MALPPSLVVAPGQEFPVVEGALGGPLGQADLEHGVIRIEREQPEVGKHIILLHEAIHVACEKLIEAGVIKRQPREEFVTNLAGTLFLMLAASGLWAGVSPKDVDQFLAAYGEDGET